MSPVELQKTLKRTLKAGLPVLIKGAPGVGKSDIVASAAADAGYDLLISHPVVSDPTDFKGLPGIVEGKAEFLPYGDLRALVTAKRPTVAFLDDLGQAPAVVQAAAMQLILARRVNGHAVSPKVVFIAATNRRQDRAGVTGILEPVKSRFAAILELVPSVDDWCAWALAHDVPEEVVAFIRFRPNLLLDTNPSPDIVNRPCPRTITYAGRLFAAGLRSLEVLAGAVGNGFAAEFLAFVATWADMPDIEDILSGPKTAPVPDASKIGLLYALATCLAGRADVETRAAICQYAARLPKEFSVLLIRDALRNYPQLAECRAYAAWAAENQDVLL